MKIGWIFYLLRQLQRQILSLVQGKFMNLPSCFLALQASCRPCGGLIRVIPGKGGIFNWVVLTFGIFPAWLRRRGCGALPDSFSAQRPPLWIVRRPAGAGVRAYPCEWWFCSHRILPHRRAPLRRFPVCAPLPASPAGVHPPAHPHLPILAYFASGYALPGRY